MRCKTMADGSLRIEVEVSPVDAQAAFALFGKPGAPMAIAALKVGYAAKPDTEREKTGENGNHREKPGPLCLEAIDYCKSPVFQRWCGAYGASDVSARREDAAADWIRAVCRVKSRKDIDADFAAAERFKRDVRGAFNRRDRERQAA